MLTWIASLYAVLAAADTDSLPSLLVEKGLIKSGSYVVFEEEEKIHDELASARKSLRRISDLEKEFRALEEQDRQLKQDAKDAEHELMRIDEQLDATPSNSPAYNNLVARHNQLAGQIRRANATTRENETLKRARSEYESARAKVVTTLRSLAPRVEDIEKKYKELATDGAVQSAIADLPAGASGKKLALGPSKTFASDARDIVRLGKKLKSEEIKLREEGGNRFVDVVINGEHHGEFVLDTGASIILLPSRMANEMGITPSANAQTAQLSEASGGTFLGKMITLRSVRVGEFEIENVDCVVANPEYPNAPALLGNSFLSQFQHQIDPGTNTLTLSRWGEDKPTKESGSRSKRKGRSKKNDDENASNE